MQLLLAQKCVDLAELDGLRFDRGEVLQQDQLWDMLAEIGVLKRPMLLPKAESLDEDGSHPESVVRPTLEDRERSLMIE